MIETADPQGIQLPPRGLGEDERDSALSPPHQERQGNSQHFTDSIPTFHLGESELPLASCHFIHSSDTLDIFVLIKVENTLWKTTHWKRGNRVCKGGFIQFCFPLQLA